MVDAPLASSPLPVFLWAKGNGKAAERPTPRRMAVMENLIFFFLI